MYDDRRTAGTRRGAPAGELSPSELRSAERGFERLLGMRRFSREFRERHLADLLAQARLEYANHIAAGEEIESPEGWIINCAWRRTQNLLERESRSLDPVPLKPRDADEDTPTPEEEALEADRRRRLYGAIEKLRPEERELLVLTYFRGMSVREASRTLKWDKCKGDRRHHAALAHLREAIGVEGIEEFEIEIGIAAWASLWGAHRAGVLAQMVQAGGRGIAAAAERAHELARRLLAGGAAEPGVATAAGTVTRTAGACGALAIACLASGVVGPGIGGVDLLGQPSPPAGHARHASAPTPAPQSAPLAEGPTQTSPAPSDGRPQGSRGAHKTRRAIHKTVSRKSAASSPSTASAATGQQVEEEFTPFAGGEPASSESTSGGGAPSSSSSPRASSGDPSAAKPATGRQVEEEFGL